MRLEFICCTLLSLGTGCLTWEQFELPRLGSKIDRPTYPTEMQCETTFAVSTTAELRSMIDVVDPETCIQLASGSYALETTIEVPDRVSIFGGDGVLFSGDDPETTLFQLADESRLVGITFSGETTAVRFGSSNGAVVEDCEFSDVAEAIRAFGAQEFTISNNRFTGAAARTVVKLHGVSGGRIVGNTFEALEIGLGDQAIRIQYGSTGTAIDRNVFRDLQSGFAMVGLGGSCSNDACETEGNFSALGLNMSNNQFINVVQPLGVAGCNACTILHNTFVDSGDRSGSIVQFSSNSGESERFPEATLFQHNVVSSDGALNAVFTGFERDRSLRVERNLFFNKNGAVSGQFPDAVASIVGDPMLREASGIFELTAGSPAIDAATESTVAQDFYNRPRPVGSAPDIGAVEFAP